MKILTGTGKTGFLKFIKVQGKGSKMAVSVIKSTEPKNANIITATAIGAGAGLAVRQFMPVTKLEIDSVLFGESEAIREASINQARKNTMKEISKMLATEKENPVYKIFFKRLKASADFAKAKETNNAKAKQAAIEMAKKAKESIKSSPSVIRYEFDKLTRKVINQVKAARVVSENSLKSAVKQQRPVSSFVLPGMALGALGAFVYNVVGTISQD